MFAFTAVSHFVPSLRAEMVKMVPPILPFPEVLVTLTGILEAIGAAGLASPWYPAAALALALLLVAMFPANVRAARAGLTVAGKAAMLLRYRLSLQLFWICSLIAVAWLRT
jgi:uncharacterized membrane protein